MESSCLIYFKRMGMIALAEMISPERSALGLSSKKKVTALEEQKIKDLTHQISCLRLANMEKDQKLAALYREVQDRDKRIALLCRKLDSTLKRSNSCTFVVPYSITSSSNKGLNIQKLSSKQLPRSKTVASSSPRTSRPSTLPTACAVVREPAKAPVKKPVPPFINYCSVHRSELKRRNPNMSASEVTCQLAKLWRELPPADQIKYC